MKIRLPIIEQTIPPFFIAKKGGAKKSSAVITLLIFTDHFTIQIETRHSSSNTNLYRVSFPQNLHNPITRRGFRSRCRYRSKKNTMLAYLHRHCLQCSKKQM